MSTRSAFTLVETAVALLVASLLTWSLYAGLRVMHRGDRSTNRDAARAVTLSRFMETLQMDIRSSSGVRQGGNRFEITRWVDEGGRLASQDVTWELRSSGGRDVMVRKTGSGRSLEFDFTGLSDEQKPVLLHIDKVDPPDMIFGAPIPPAGGNSP